MKRFDQKPPAVVLLSGGLDSATCLAMANDQGFEPHALSFRYGQRHAVELLAAQRVAQALGARRHLILDVDLRGVGGSALTADMAVPKGRSLAEMTDGVPVTYVPARNTLFLSLALAWAETLDCADIFIGVNALDYSGYPDCRPEFILAFENLANLATKMSTEQGRYIRVHAPLIRMTKAQIIRAGLALGVDYGLTHSCYDPDADGKPCGQCDSCLLRAKGFAEAKTPDPALKDS
ncbi:exsB protein [Desulfarculus baarsii DSM 2075]|uniref:7-cyano-7-deazaguanine synthase n=1 Tax=Desulfarculus baarsii (strain ATCC 33931 / DSM 2075 / LMG 7858 / VKM B-1802 / 2st14) TaxID=644282 RepID=E1QIA2_DESB2|nr:7-cyano-7-deazaguanine synthase QueC [Desulfarculus baarsii]ADK85419.1 exsB protein [Desulfarculus baarsii DSM 2075]